jgi:DNA helicase II / ATP-dependent DNA helicase PcrA
MTNLSSELEKIIEEESSTLSKVLLSLVTQINRVSSRLRIEQDRARELTSELVESRRAEDKAMLASDEAVSHALKDQRFVELETLKKLTNKPYFARVVVEEEDGNGKIVEFEYKIGFETNLDCRIIDWRKAPLSKLYYQYREGDDYCEEIQGRERVGQVILRHRLEIDNGQLNKIGGNFGELIRENKSEKWLLTASRARGSGSYSQLPDVLSLITAEQFVAITENAKTAVLIQGIAGSGKTTVAIHRLAWLLESDNSDITPFDSAIIVLSPAIKTYIKNSLGSIGAGEVRVFNFDEWVSFSITGSTLPLTNATDQCPLTIQRVKLSKALLSIFEEVVNANYLKNSSIAGKEQLILDYSKAIEESLLKTRTIIERDKTKLIDAESIKRTLQRQLRNRELGVIDSVDYPLIMRFFQITRGSIYLPNAKYGLYKHLVIDEVQDLSHVHLACIGNSVDSTKQLTLVGDVAQTINSNSGFPGWEEVIKSFNSNEETAKFLQLEVSFRSTLPIMKLGDHVLKRMLVTEGRDGRTPIWFHGNTEDNIIESIIQWLSKAIEKYPSALTAVLCKNPEESRYIYSLLSPTFGQTIRLDDNGFFSLDEGIIVSEIAQVKGLEFCNVALWNVSSKNYRDSVEQDSNLLYVGITRAEENLSIYTTGSYSKLLPNPNSSIIRYVEIVEEVEETDKELVIEQSMYDEY